MTAALFLDTHPRSRARARGPKTASGGFFRTAETRARKSRRKSLHSRRVAWPAATKTASGVRYYGRRYYNPGQGRFVGRDTLGEKGGLHLYAFCRNNAISRWDLLGMLDSDTVNQNADGGGGGLNFNLWKDSNGVWQVTGSAPQSAGNPSSFAYDGPFSPIGGSQTYEGGTLPAFTVSAFPSASSYDSGFTFSDGFSGVLTGAVEGFVTGLVTGAALGALAVFSPATVTVLTGTALVVGAYQWYQSGFQVTPRGVGNAIGGLVGGGIGFWAGGAFTRNLWSMLPSAPFGSGVGPGANPTRGSIGVQGSANPVAVQIGDPGRFNTTVSTVEEALALIKATYPNAVELPAAQAGVPYQKPPSGVTQWFRIEPAEPNVGNNLPHIKFVDWTQGGKRNGGSWGHIFFNPGPQ